MRDFPQDLVDMVIDKLAERPDPTDESPPEYNDISRYSTVSRQWVERTQKYHFRVLLFDRQSRLEKWRTGIQVHPSGGVSRHVRRLVFRDIPTLQGFEDQIRAFTGIKEAGLCIYTLKSLSKVETLVLMGSSLVRLEIAGMETTPYTMASLLAGLPHLRYLYACYLRVDPDNDAPALPSNIPFFESTGTFDLRMVDYSPEKLNWIPPTARFGDLRIDVCCIWSIPAVVNKWFASSGEDLERLTIREETAHGAFCDPLDLSGCTSLKYLQFPAPFLRPWQYAGIILPSLSSPQLSRVDLESWTQLPSEREPDQPLRPIDPAIWERMDGDLCRLAKQFKAAHDGRMMELGVSMVGYGAERVLDQLKDEWPMPDMGKEATITWELGEM